MRWLVCSRAVASHRAPAPTAKPIGSRPDDTGYEALAQLGAPIYPASGLRSSARDLAVFLAAFIDDGEVDGRRILDSGTVQQMRECQFPDVDSTQALVWYYVEAGGVELLEHTGGLPGVATLAGYRTEDGVGFVILGNMSHNTQYVSVILNRLLEVF